MVGPKLSLKVVGAKLSLSQNFPRHSKFRVCVRKPRPPIIVLELLRAAGRGVGCQRYPLNTSNVAWFKGREWFQDRACSMPKDDALIAELTSPTYAFTSTGKMVVESKADMKKRGLRSPDLADAFLLTFACGERKIERHRRQVRRCSGWAA